MSTLVGRKACINGIPSMAYFQLKEFSDAKGIVVSGSKGGNLRNCGNKHWTVEIYAYGHTPLVFPNETFTFAGALKAGDTTAKRRAYGLARCKEIEIIAACSDPGAYVMHRILAEGSPVVAADVLQFDNTSIADVAPSNLFCASGLDVTLDGGDEAGVEWMRLLIASDFESYKDSDLAGWYQNQPGNIDWQFSYRRKFGAWDELPAVDSLSEIKMNVTTGTPTYWDLKWGRFTRPIDAKVEPAARQPLSATVIAEMDGYNSADGYIKTPAGTTKWPEA